MNVLSLLFLGSLLLGQIGAMPVYPGVVLYVHDIVLAILFVEAFVQFSIRGGKGVKPALTVPILLFVVAGALSLLTNSGRFELGNLGVSALYLARWAFYAGIYVVVLQRYVKREIWTRGLFSVGVGLGIIGLVQFVLYPDLRNLSYLGWDPHYYRLFSTFLDPNFVGLFFVLTILLGVHLWEEKKLRLWVAIGGLLAFAALLLTYSRSSYLAFAAAIITVSAVKKQWLLLAAVLAFAAVVILLPRTPGSTLDLLRRDSTIARLGNWREGVALFMQAPVLGHGLNTLRYISGSSSNLSKSAAGLDSSLLFIAATTGIVGLLAYGYLIYSMLRVGKRFAFYAANFAALGVHSLFVNSAFYPWILLWMWIVTAVVENR